MKPPPESDREAAELVADLRPLLLRAANSLHDLTVGGEAAQLGDTSNLEPCR